MRSYMVYEAEDGERFRTEEECVKHEYYLNHLPLSIVWYDKDWDELVPESSHEVDRLYNECAYMEILNTENWKEDLDFLGQNWGYGERDMEPGFYKYIGECSSDEVDEYRDRGFRIYGWDEWIRLAKKGGKSNG